MNDIRCDYRQCDGFGLAVVKNEGWVLFFTNYGWRTMDKPTLKCRVHECIDLLLGV